jgi:hypothetical protein
MVLVIVSTVASYAVAWLIGVPALVPILNAAVPWWLMAGSLGRGEVRRAIAIMLVWALTMGATSTVMAAAGWSRRAEGRELFLRSQYRDEMIQWVRTGRGPESQPSVFVPRHLGYAAVFSVASIATAGIASMPMGAVLMNQMGEYVGAMTAQSVNPFASALLGWHPWAVVRIIGFVMIGVVLSGPLLSRFRGVPFSLADHRGWLQLGVALLVLDLLLKWALAPAWARILRGIAGW